MVYRWNKIAQLSALGACCSLAVWIGSISAIKPIRKKHPSW